MAGKFGQMYSVPTWREREILITSQAFESKMDTGPAYILAILIVLVLLVGVAYGWYNFSGSWSDFSYTGGQKVAFSSGKRQINRLRFRKCIFTTQDPSGKKASWDVTAILNGMAVAHDIDSNNNKLPLGGSSQIPLNPFSFIQGGFNDRAAVPTAADRDTWQKVPDSATTLTGEMRVL